MPQSEGSMADSNAVVSVDGRRQRGERTRQAIIEAALSLQEEGVLVPTAQQISDRAGVLIRSFFRHFEDMANKDVAVVLGIQENAASNRYVRALGRLKAFLGGFGDS